MRFTRASSADETKVLSRSLSFALALLFRIMCDVLAWNLLTFPEPVTLNLFFALECVFILGIISIFFLTDGKGNDYHLISQAFKQD